MSDNQQVSLSQARAAHSSSRRKFLGQSVLAGIGLTGAGALTGPALAGAPFPGGLQQPSLNDFRLQVRRAFRDLRRQENDHVIFLRDLLGGSARPRPHFFDLEQDNFGLFVRTAQTLENITVAAYLGALEFFSNSDALATAASMTTIEARQAGWLNTLRGDRLTDGVNEDNQTFETPLTDDQTVVLLTPYIEDLNGGPPLEYSTTPSAGNDVDILNFMLALEILQDDFYNDNVQRFFPQSSP